MTSVVADEAQRCMFLRRMGCVTMYLHKKPCTRIRLLYEIMHCDVAPVLHVQTCPRVDLYMRRPKLLEKLLSLQKVEETEDFIGWA